MTLHRHRVLIRLLLLGAWSVLLQAGPPFRTDDPEPVPLGHLELYLFSAIQRVPEDVSGIGPAVEFNYGILPDTQFHAIVAYDQDRPRSAPSRGGLGDTEVGIKFRFLHETEALPQIGIFPLVEIPTGDSGKGLGSGHTQIYLPVWAQKSWGPWTTYGGYGRWRNPGEGNRDWTYAGWLIQRNLGEALTLGVEGIHHSAMTRAGLPSSGFNVGGQVNVSEKHHFLFSAGRNFTGEAQSFFYVGYQFTTGTFADLGDWFRRGSIHS